MTLEVWLKSAFVLLLVAGVLVPLTPWLERRQAALAQGRSGPDRAAVAGVTLLGLLQPVADLIKLAGKESPAPAGASRWLFGAAPVVGALPPLLAFAIVPFGSRYAFGDATLSLAAADPDWGLLYAFVLATVGLFGTVLAGWASRNAVALLGSLRAAAQLVSHQLPLGLAAAACFLSYGTLSLSEMAAAQDGSFRALGFVELLLGRELPLWVSFWLRLPAWGVLVQPLAAAIFLTAILAANQRPPFDLAVSDSELAGGARLAYTGLRQGLFRLADCAHVVLIAALFATLFLGGWALPWLSQETLVTFFAAGVGFFEGFGAGFANGLCLLLHVVSFLAKVLLVMWLQTLIHGALPRVRYDQLMALCWKLLVPLAVLNLFATGAVLLWLRGLAPVTA